MNVNRGLAQELGLTSLAVSEAIFFFFVIKRIGISYRHMEKYGLGHWALGLYLDHFLTILSRGGATIRTQGGVGCSPSVLRKG